MRKSILTFSFAILATTAVLSQEKNTDKKKPIGPPSIKQIFKDLDKNEDGKISLKEVKGPLKKDFKKIDLNKDGFITKEELKKAPKPEPREKPRN
ncbi:MAG: Ca2+-binding EF-hand superfamily protein [Polaribacter sp.]|jgi:Ca2+-binding EF-hand superfamily protein